MSQLSNACLIAGLALAGAASAQEPPAGDDPYAWLEKVDDKASLDWVKARNAKAEAEIATTAEFKSLEAEILAILDSDAKIPGVEKIGAYYYNFWKDKQHERGLWRRTTLAEYRKPNPAWETVLDLDALNVAEGRKDEDKWVWHGADCLRPAYERCLVALSPGGSDADVTREFDLTTKQFVKDGFFRAEAKGGLSWIDRDTVYVYTDFGKGSLTSSGYPNIVKEWKRGTPMSAAKTVYEGKPGDMYIAAGHDHTPGYERDFVNRTIAFYNDELYLRGADGSLAKVDAPNSAQKGVHKDWLVLELREPYEAGGKTYKPGSLIATDFNAFMAGKRAFTVLFEPTDNSSLAGYTWTKDYLVLNVMEDVKNRLFVLKPGKMWSTQVPFVGAPTIGTVGVGAVDDEDSNAVWLTATDFLTPTTLSIAEMHQHRRKC
jgi:prolyl oligopeptidase